MYNEIKKLHLLLLSAQIEHEWINRNDEFDPDGVLKSDGFDMDWGYQIIVYRPDGERLVSAIEGYGTYGAKADRIEIMGLTTKDEGDVCGWLTAENVFARIQHYYEKQGLTQ